MGQDSSSSPATRQAVTRGDRRAGEEEPSQGGYLWPVRSASWALAQTQSWERHREDYRPGTSLSHPILVQPRLPQGTSCSFCHAEGNTELGVACKYWACARRCVYTGRRLDSGFIITNGSLAITPLRASKISDSQTGQGRREQEKGLLTLLEKASALRRGGPMMDGSQRGH